MKLKEKHVMCPLDSNVIRTLCVGDKVFLSGIVYTARDAAHQRMQEDIKKLHKMPFDLLDQVIYYVGPTPTRPGQICGSAGPTTSSRMDVYTPELLGLGVKGMIGKGRRSSSVIEAIIKNESVYFAAIGGIGALLSAKIVACDVIAYQDLGPEAIHRCEIRDFPVIVAIDSNGRCIYPE